MSFVSSRVFRGCRVLLASAKSSAAAADAAKPAAAKPKAAAPKPKAEKPKRDKPARISGILKTYPVSPALRDFMGAPETSRTEAVKQIWAYIKQNNLQNPADKREIFCDEKLKSIFDGKEKVGFLEIGKLLSQHFVKAA